MKPGPKSLPMRELILRRVIEHEVWQEAEASAGLRPDPGPDQQGAGIRNRVKQIMGAVGAERKT